MSERFTVFAYDSRGVSGIVVSLIDKTTKSRAPILASKTDARRKFFQSECITFIFVSFFVGPLLGVFYLGFV